MPNMEIKTISFTELFNHPDFTAMCGEYLDESGNADIGSALPDKALYLKQESFGTCFCIGAFDRSILVGFAVLTLREHPHYSKTIGACDALFVRKEARKGYAGLKLIRAVQEMGKTKGAAGVVFSAPFGSRLSKLFDRLFVQTDCVYWAA